GDVVDTSTPAVSWVSQKMWWSKTGLSPGKHTVTVKHVGKNTEYANVDFFMYMPSDPSAEPASSNNKVLIGTIIGAVVGGLVGLVGLAFFAFFLYRRKRATKEESTPKTEEVKEGVHVVTLTKKGSEDTLATVDEKMDAKEIV
ncbi:hypothetical protein FRC07_003051, partial [Ceratobasidium sp. 392]